MAGSPKKRARNGAKAPQPQGVERFVPRPKSGIVSSGSREAFTPGDDGTGKAMAERKIALNRLNRETVRNAYVQMSVDEVVTIRDNQRRALSLMTGPPPSKEELDAMKVALGEGRWILEQLIGKATQVQAQEDTVDSAISKARKWAQKPGGSDGGGSEG